jgi:hypothetical protein
MRDIRGDLKDRAEALDREIKAAQHRFDDLLLRLKEEHGLRLNELKSELDAVRLLIGLEQRLMANGPAQANGVQQTDGAQHISAAPHGNAVPQAKPQEQGEAPRPQAQNQPSRPQQRPEAGLRRAG